MPVPGPAGREVYFEFVAIGNAVKVTAIDSVTAIEVSAMGPVPPPTPICSSLRCRSQGPAALARAALKSLILRAR